MKPVFLTASALLISSTASIAAPTVTGNIISWPEDGWYQVQNEADYTEVCAGGRSCEVGAGSYVVINHTTGERFPNISVDGNANDEHSDSPIAVSGNTLSWPDDGWYQVQRSDTYESVCGGGLSCEVADGNYIVINHTSGERFTNIRVPGSATDTNPDLNGVSVENYTLSWPDDGWYQVQRWYRDVNHYETVCSGGRSCFVEFGGTYIVVNHHTGTRTTLEIDQGSNALDKDNYEATIGDMLRVYIGGGIGSIHAPDFADTLSSLPDFVHEELVDSMVDCNYSGTATITYVNAANETGYDYVFDACKSEEYSGLYGSINVVQSGEESVVTAEDFADSTSPVSGSRYQGVSRRSLGNFSVAEFDLIKDDSHGLGAYLTDGNYSWNRSIGNDGSFVNRIEGSFDFRQRNTARGESLTAVADDLSVELSPQQTQALQDDFSQVYPVTGTLEITAEDGSRILLDAATGDNATVSITIENSYETTAVIGNWSTWDADLRLDEVGRY